MDLLPIYMTKFCLAQCSRDMNVYLVLSIFSSRSLFLTV